MNGTDLIRLLRPKLGVLLAAMVLLLVAQGALNVATSMTPPSVNVAFSPIQGGGSIQRLGNGYARLHGGIREVYLEGTPEEIGAQQGRLNYDAMVENERALWGDFSRYVPFWPARALIMDLSRVRYRHLDRGIPAPRLREIAAQAQVFKPDPFEGELPTYQRMVFLHSLYDVALSFEHSPLMGCSTFGLGPGATKDAHTILARAFDFEAADVFDRSKAVFFVREGGAIPFASVAWPGLVGVISGMNAEGVAVVVHGARAGAPIVAGEPVVLMLREVLERARDTAEAIAILRTQQVMVSHIVVVADASGRFAVVERAPGVPPFVRDTFPDPDRVAVTNHFEGPLKDDPKNVAVREKTSTVARRQRLDELLLQVGPRDADVRRAVGMLRDHKCARGLSCDIGDRRTIDALIATHGIVADTTDRVLWVSAGPHLSGHFTRFDLKTIFAGGHVPEMDEAAETLLEDPILRDGRYEAGRARSGEAVVSADRGEGAR